MYIIINFIQEWEDQNVIAMFSYLVLLTSIGFNIFIFCFIGEQLSVEVCLLYYGSITSNIAVIQKVRRQFFSTY